MKASAVTSGGSAITSRHIARLAASLNATDQLPWMTGNRLKTAGDRKPFPLAVMGPTRLLARLFRNGTAKGTSERRETGRGKSGSLEGTRPPGAQILPIVLQAHPARSIRDLRASGPARTRTPGEAKLKAARGRVVAGNAVGADRRRLPFPPARTTSSRAARTLRRVRRAGASF